MSRVSPLPALLASVVRMLARGDTARKDFFQVRPGERSLETEDRGDCSTVCFDRINFFSLRVAPVACTGLLKGAGLEATIVLRSNTVLSGLSVGISAIRGLAMWSCVSLGLFSSGRSDGLKMLMFCGECAMVAVPVLAPGTGTL